MPEESVLARLTRYGVVPVVRMPDPSIAVPLARTLLGAGLPCLEVTFRAAGAAGAIAAIREQVPDVLVGAGTVLTPAQAIEALDAGACFVVAPGTNRHVVDAVLGRGGVMIPGVATPTEIEANLMEGIDTLKLFPAEVVGGVAFLRAVLGPYPTARFVPTGGVSPANLASYLAQPNVAACGGTWIAPAEVLAVRDLGSVEAAALAAVDAVRQARL